MPDRRPICDRRPIRYTRHETTNIMYGALIIGCVIGMVLGVAATVIGMMLTAAAGG